MNVEVEPRERREPRTILRIAGVQMAMTSDRPANLAKAETMVEAAAARGAGLVVLPELFGSLYFPQRAADPSFFELAEPIPGPTSDALGAQARRLGVMLVGSVYERVFGGLLYNTALVFGRDGSLLGRSRKAHIPDGPGYSEKFYFTPGDSDYPVFELAVSARTATMAVPTCWDQWFPEVARIAALKGAELIVYPTAIGSEPAFPGVDTHDAWRTVMRGHAVANALFVLAVNRVGTEADLTFYGGSFVADPMGRVVAELGAEEGLLEAAVDLAIVDETRALSPFFRDRRPETYETLLTRGGRRG